MQIEPIVVEVSVQLRVLVDQIMEKRELGSSNMRENEEAVRQLSHAIEYDSAEVHLLDRLRIVIGEICDDRFYEAWDVGEPQNVHDTLCMAIDILELIRDGKVL